jgi:serine/threonine protein kinase
MGPDTPTRVGRYTIYDQIASGGMATVHLARLAGQAGFSRVVAVKRMHPHLLSDAQFKKMFVNEARLAARIRHPNVVPILDVIVKGNEILIVMEYVHGVPLTTLISAAHAAGAVLPLPVTAALMVNVLHGLQAAHEARNEQGVLLGLVHRDVSPQNILVGEDGVARLLDFGIAKAAQARQETHPGTVKGKHSYFAPEALRSEPVTGQADIFSTAVVFWELLTGTKLFDGQTAEARMLKIINGNYPRPSRLAPDTPPTIERIVMKGLELDVHLRYETALEMAADIDETITVASQRVVGEAVSRLASDALAQRAALLQQIEISKIESIGPPSSLPPARHVGGRYTPGLSQRPTLAAPPMKRPRRWLLGAALFAIAAAGATFALIYRSRAQVTASAAEPSSGVASVAVPAAPSSSAGPGAGAVSEPAPSATVAIGGAYGSTEPAANPVTPHAPQPTQRSKSKAPGPGSAKFLPNKL